MLLLLAGTCPRGAAAGIDVTGAWYLLIVGQAKTLVHFVQRGTSLRVEGRGAVSRCMPRRRWWRSCGPLLGRAGEGLSRPASSERRDGVHRVLEAM
jgi:hypothetical protein